MPKSVKTWMSERLAADRLQISRASMRRIAILQGLRQRQLPGLNRIEYLAEDVERIEREAITVAQHRGPSLAPEGSRSPATGVEYPPGTGGQDR